MEWWVLFKNRLNSKVILDIAPTIHSYIKLNRGRVVEFISSLKWLHIYSDKHKADKSQETNYVYNVFWVYFYLKAIFNFRLTPPPDNFSMTSKFCHFGSKGPVINLWTSCLALEIQAGIGNATTMFRLSNQEDVLWTVFKPKRSQPFCSMNMSHLGNW